MRLEIKSHFEHQLVDLWLDLFIELSNAKFSENRDEGQLELPKSLKTHLSLKHIINLIYQRFNQSPPKLELDPKYSLLHRHRSNLATSNKVLLGFTGGKDSTYLAIHLRKLGLDPILVYIRGVNRCYPSEYSIAQKISKILEYPLIVVELTFSGKMPFISNPVKNGVILAILFDIGLQLGINKISLGTHKSTNLEDTNPLSTISDSIEFMDKVYLWGKNFIPNLESFNIDLPISRLYKILDENNLISEIQSCLGTERYKNYLSNRNIKKFRIEQPLPNRCYSCYKCALEYLNLESLNIVSSNERLFKHCLNIICKKWSDIVLENKPNIKHLNNKQVYDLVVNRH